MTFKVGNQTIEGKVTLGPPILLIKGKSTAEQPKAHVTPEKLKAFQEALGKLFGMESILLSAEDLKNLPLIILALEHVLLAVRRMRVHYLHIGMMCRYKYEFQYI